MLEEFLKSCWDSRRREELRLTESAAPCLETLAFLTTVCGYFLLTPLEEMISRALGDLLFKY